MELSRVASVAMIQAVRGSSAPRRISSADAPRGRAFVTRPERDIAEMASAHKVGDEVEQAYSRGTALTSSVITMAR
jgi:hypothetical protein